LTPMQDEVLEKVAPTRGLTTQELHNARTELVPLGRGSSPRRAPRWSGSYCRAKLLT
jgi:hypothetical protein